MIISSMNIIDNVGLQCVYSLFQIKPDIYKFNDLFITVLKSQRVIRYILFILLIFSVLQRSIVKLKVIIIQFVRYIDIWMITFSAIILFFVHKM